MNRKLILALGLVALILISFSLVIGQKTVGTTHKTATPIPADKLAPVAQPSPSGAKDFCDLFYTDWNAVYFYALWKYGDKVAIYFDPEDCGHSVNYPFQLSGVNFYLYDHAYVGACSLRFSVEVVCPDICDGPGIEIWKSPVYTIDTFYPNMDSIFFSDTVCLDKPFFFNIEFVSDYPEGNMPSLVWDDQLADTCYQWIWVGQPAWWEWHDFGFEGWVLLGLSGHCGEQQTECGWWYWKPDTLPQAPSGMPDFDQNQDAWVCYCGPTAVANCLWWFDAVPEGWTPPQLIDTLARYFSTNVGISGTYVDSIQVGLERYFADYGFALTETTYWMPDFYEMEDSLKVCQDIILLLGFWWWQEGGQQFIRGDINEDGAVNVADIVDCYYPPFSCDDAADVNDDGVLDTLDCVYLNNFLLAGGPPPPPPFPSCGLDPTSDALNCAHYPPCPYEPGEWFREGGHFVTMAGVNSEKKEIAISDPDRDQKVRYPWWPGRVRLADHLPWGAYDGTYHNDPRYVSHDVYVSLLFPEFPSPGSDIWDLADYCYGQTFPLMNVPHRFEAYSRAAPKHYEYFHTEVEAAVMICPKDTMRNHFKTWRIEPETYSRVVEVEDQFMLDTLFLEAIEFFSNPCRKDTFEIVDEFEHLTWYRAQGRNTLLEVEYRNQFGTYTNTIDSVKYLLLPTAKQVPDPFPENLDHYKAYRIKDPVSFDRQLELEDQFDIINGATESIMTLKPTYFLTPALKNYEEPWLFDSLTHYVAYEIFPDHYYGPLYIQTFDQFGEHSLRVDTSKFLLVPTKKLRAEPPNNPPEIGQPDFLEGYVDDVVEYEITGSDPDGDVILDEASIDIQPGCGSWNIVRTSGHGTSSGTWQITWDTEGCTPCDTHMVIHDLTDETGLVGYCTTWVHLSEEPWPNHKMHYPQLPDLEGWDVFALDPKTLADDWQCSETGWVTDIHFWGSWKDLDGDPSTDDYYTPMPWFRLSIHRNIPASADTPWSRPGEQVWFWEGEIPGAPFEPPAMEHWFNPNTNEVLYNDHVPYWRYDFFFDLADPPPEPFYQYKDSVYWLNVSAINIPAPYEWGWKSSRDHFMDDAVFTDTPPDGPWYPLFEPPRANWFDFYFNSAGEPIDMGSTNYYGAGWYAYEYWWNMWFYNNPFVTNPKHIWLDFYVEEVGPAAYVEFAINWSTDLWATEGVPGRPPLPGEDETLYIGREIFEVLPGWNTIDFWINDYNPEWVSIDFVGVDVIINGWIWHECVQTSMDLAFVITGEEIPPDTLQNHYKTWRIEPQTFSQTVFVEDQFMLDTLILEAIEFFSNPAKKDTFEIVNGLEHLTWYRAYGRNTLLEVEYTNQFGTYINKIDSVKYLLLPTAKESDVIPESLDHYKAYRIKDPVTFERQLVLEDQFDIMYGAPEDIDSLKPIYFLTPALKNMPPPMFDSVTHYVAYEIFPKRLFPLLVNTLDQFGWHDLYVEQAEILLVPTLKLRAEPPPNDPPEIGQPDFLEGYVDDVVSYDITGSDPNGDVILDEASIDIQPDCGSWNIVRTSGHGTSSGTWQVTWYTDGCAVCDTHMVIHDLTDEHGATGYCTTWVHLSEPDSLYWKEPYEDYAPNGMPDIDQKQDNWIKMETGAFTFCGPVAVANCFKWFDSKYNVPPGAPGDGMDQFPLVRDYMDNLAPFIPPARDDHDPWNVDHAGTPWGPPANLPPPTAQPFVPGPQPQPSTMPAWGELVERLAWYFNTDGIRTGYCEFSGTNVFDMQAGIDQWFHSEMFPDGSTLADTLYEYTIPMPTFAEIETLVEMCEDVILLLGFWWYEGGGEQQFIRGDVNEDGVVNQADVDLCLLGPPFSCDDAVDVNDDGILEPAECVYLDQFLNFGGPPPEPPFPDCGPDITPDGLDCAEFPPCPPGGPVQWWRCGGHYVTVAGVNSEDFLIAVADPFFDNAEAGGRGRVGDGTLIPHPHGSHDATVHNDEGNVSHDIYSVSIDPVSPGGLWELVGYPVSLNPGYCYDFSEQNIPPEFETMTQPWDGTSPIYTEVEYAVVISPRNHPPEIIQPDSLEGFIDDTVTYTFDGIDPNGDVILDSASLQIVPSCGAYSVTRIAGHGTSTGTWRVTWYTDGCEACITYLVIVDLTDEHGATSYCTTYVHLSSPRECDDNDPHECDTLYVECGNMLVPPGGGLVTVNLSIAYDESLMAFQVPLSYEGSPECCDSMPDNENTVAQVFAGSIVPGSWIKIVTIDHQNKKVIVAGAALTPPSDCMQPGRGHLGTLTLFGDSCCTIQLDTTDWSNNHVGFVDCNDPAMTPFYPVCRIDTCHIDRNYPPEIEQPDFLEGYVDDVVTYTITGNDPDGDVIRDTASIDIQPGCGSAYHITRISGHGTSSGTWEIRWFTDGCTPCDTHMVIHDLTDANGFTSYCTTWVHLSESWPNHKMHYPQLPDPEGWDVVACEPIVLADDFMCTKSGRITDIHLWGSWRMDLENPIDGFLLSIHENIPGPPYSRPGELLWEAFIPDYEVTPEEPGMQGWYDPAMPFWEYPDHMMYYRYDITNIPEPFCQDSGTIYWLNVMAIGPMMYPDPPLWGWKTSRLHYEDDGVWAHYTPPVYEWQPLTDPITGETLDLSFVITGEDALCGDVNHSGAAEAGDIVFLISYLFRAGPAPCPLLLGDVNCDGDVGAGDVVYLISYLFRGGPDPCDPDGDGIPDC